MTGNHIKRVGFIASKRADSSLDICLSRKALKCLLQNIYMMLDLLYKECYPLFRTVVDGSIFKKNIYDYNLTEKS